MIKYISNAILGVAFSVGMTTASASYPERPVKLVVPYTPAGSADQLARALAQNMAQALGKPVVVENKPGASTRIDRKSTRLNSSHVKISYAVFCLKKKTRINRKRKT